MLKIIEACALPNHHLYVRFSDGAEGEVDVSDLLRAGGVFEAWRDIKFFEQVRVEVSRRGLYWSDKIDLCADALYLRLTHKIPQDIFPQLAHEEARA